MSQNPVITWEVTEPTVMWAVFSHMKVAAIDDGLPELEGAEITLRAKFAAPLTAAQSAVFRDALERVAADYVKRWSER